MKIKPIPVSIDDSNSTLSSQLWTQDGNSQISGDKLCLRINFCYIGIEISAFDKEMVKTGAQLLECEIGSSVQDRYGQTFTRIK